MRNLYGEQLEQLHVELIRMGALCEDAISYATRTLMGEGNFAEDVSRCEHDIDTKEREIESLCIRLLLKQQPVAGDLRAVSSALKMVGDLERIGDQAYDIVEICPYINGHGRECRQYLKEMAEATRQMVTNAIDSYVKNDLDIARGVMQADDTVDSLFDRAKRELIGYLTNSGEEDAGEVSIDLLMIAKYYERIGDHAVNIAEWVEYAITGTHR